MHASPPSQAVSARELVKVGLLAFLVLLVALLGFFGPGVARGSELFFTNDVGGADLWHLYYPFWHFASECLEQGDLPLWCPDLGTGFPLLAEGQVAALHPLNLLLQLTLPTPAAFNGSILLHLALAGAFAAMFARQVGAGRGGSLLTGLVFGLGGFFVVHVKHPNLNATAAWFPLLLLLVDRYADRRRARALAALAVAVALSLLAGHPQMAYYGLLLAGCYATLRLAAIWRRGREGGGGGSDALRTGGALAYAVLIGALLAGPQLLPTYELKELGPRKEGLAPEEATRSEYTPGLLLTFILPKVFGDPGVLRAVPAVDPHTGEPRRHPETGEPLEELVGFKAGGTRLFWEVTAYVGLLPLALAFLGIVLGRPLARLVPLLILLGLALLLTFGKAGGLYTFFRDLLPGFDLFRFPSRFLVYVAFFLAVLAGLGLSRVLELLPGKRVRVLRPALAATALAVCFVDLKIAFGDHNPTIDALSWTTPSPCARRIHAEEKDGPPFRIVTVDPGRWVFYNAYYRARGWKGDLSPYEPARNTLDPNLSLLYGLDSLLTYSPSTISWADEASFLIMPPPNPVTGRLGDVQPKIAALLNVRYLIDPFNKLSELLEPVAEFPGDVLLTENVLLPAGPPYTIRLYRNPTVLPRAFLVPRARLVRDSPVEGNVPTVPQSAVLSPTFDPTREVLITTAENLPPTSLGGDPSPIESPVQIEEYEARRVRLRASAPRDCWLFLSDTFYPGWEATVDGRETPIYRANIVGRAVRLPAGDHEVTFVYRPSSFRWGLAACALGLLLVASLRTQRRLLGLLAARWPAAP